MLNTIKKYIAALHPLYENRTFDSYLHRDVMRDVYHDYQNSYIWRQVVSAVKERDKNICKICGKKPNKGYVHHTTYRNWGKGDCLEIGDCIYVCQGCHTSEHKSKDQSYVPFWASRDKEVRFELSRELYMREI